MALTPGEAGPGTVGVLGLGYGGLPLALDPAGAAADVVAFDVSADRVATLA